MDPDTNLKEIRKLINKHADDSTYEDHQRLCELIESLDSWLCIGGFLPKDWKKK